MIVKVTTRASTKKDILEGLRGHEYIQARCLNRKVTKIEQDSSNKESLINNWDVKNPNIYLFLVL